MSIIASFFTIGDSAGITITIVLSSAFMFIRAEPLLCPSHILFPLMPIIEIQEGSETASHRAASAPSKFTEVYWTQL